MAKRTSSIKRILIALDGSPSSMSALERCAELANRLDAELIGLFVEDINLLRATQLPFTREVNFFSSGFRRLEASDLERQLRVQADRVRRLMERITSTNKLPAMFRVARGAVAEEILNAGKDADLLVLGKIGRSLPGFLRSGSTVRRVVVQRLGMTLVWHVQGSRVRPVVLTYDGSESSGKALDVAVTLQELNESGLIVYLVAHNRKEAEQLRLEVMEKLEQGGVRVTFRTLVPPDFHTLSQLLQKENAGPVVLPCDREQMSGENLCALVDEIANPVLLVK